MEKSRWACSIFFRVFLIGSQGETISWPKIPLGKKEK